MKLLLTRGLVGAAIAGTIALVAPHAAESAASTGSVAHCANRAGTTSYEFLGGVRGMPATSDEWKIVEYRGRFDAADKDNPDSIPTMGKNNFNIKIPYNNYTANTPDDIEYGVVYTRNPAPTWWKVPYGREVHAEFLANFDKRGTPDKQCAGATYNFTVPAPPEAACIDLLNCQQT